MTPTAGGNDPLALPAVVDRATWQAELDALRAREKAHTRAGDAIAAARRRLPMVEVDTPLIGRTDGSRLLETFEGRRQLIAYYFMWYAGRPAEEQCEGRADPRPLLPAFPRSHVRDLLPGAYEKSVRYRDFMDWDMPWYSVHDSAKALPAGRRVNRFYLVC